MSSISIMPATGLIAAQADFVAQFGTFLADSQRVGLVACDLEDDGEIVYGPVEGRLAPLQPIFNIDGSPRQGNVRNIEIPELKDMRDGESGKSPFYKDVFALQKSIEVPLAPLLRELGRTELHSRDVGDRLVSHIAMVGDMSARQFLAENYDKPPDDKARIIRPIAQDLSNIAERMVEDGRGEPNVYLINSAALFAALGDRESDARAVDNFFAAAKSLFGAGNFVTVAVLAETASKVGDRGTEDEDRAADLKTLMEVRTLAANAWYESLDIDFGPETYAFRLYRGMRSAWNIQDKTTIDKLLERASHMNLARADFPKVAADYLRRAWYATQRFPMSERDWVFVRGMINGAAAMWIGQSKSDDEIGQLLQFAKVTEKLGTQSRFHTI